MSASIHQTHFSSPLFLHPLILFFIENIVFILIAGFTPRRSAIRLLGLFFVTLCTSLAMYCYQDFINSTGWAGRVPAGNLFLLPVMFFDRLILRGWAYRENYGSEPKTSMEKRMANGSAGTNQKRDNGTSSSAVSARLAFGLELSSSMRGVGSHWKVKGVPPFSTSDAQYVPSVFPFVLRNLLSIVLCYVIHDIAADAQLNLDHSLLSSSCVPVLSRVTSIPKEEVVVRSMSTLGYWIVQYCLIQSFYSLFTILSVCSKPNKVEQWPPIFGSIADAYTMRGFWSSFWHQIMRSSLENPASVLTHSLLHLPRHSLVARYAKIFLSFAISGAMHVAADLGGSMRLSETGAMRFFVTQVLGIAIEDAVQAVYRRTAKPRPIMARVCGYAWVVVFLLWSTPVWVYPVTRAARREDTVLRVGALTPLFRSFSRN